MLSQSKQLILPFRFVLRMQQCEVKQNLIHVEVFEMHTHHAWNILCKVSPERNWCCPKPRCRSRSSDPQKNRHLCCKAQYLAFIIMKAQPEWKKYWKKPANSKVHVLLLLSRNSCSTRLPPSSRAPSGRAAPKRRTRSPGKPRPAPRTRSPGRAANRARHCGAPWRRPAEPFAGRRFHGSPGTTKRPSNSRRYTVLRHTQAKRLLRVRLFINKFLYAIMHTHSQETFPRGWTLPSLSYVTRAHRDPKQHRQHCQLYSCISFLLLSSWIRRFLP